MDLEDQSENPPITVTCPTCNTRIEGYRHDNGMRATNPYGGPYGGPGTMLGTWDEVKNASQYASKVEAAPEFGMVALDPCGHSFRGYEGGLDLLARILEAQRQVEVDRAEAVIAEQADLLAAAEAHGAGAVAQRWRAAVRTSSAEASGLLAAMRTLVGR
jgi:hypothetical protein